MATNGLVVMTPTSIAYSGTSASINADGSVDFSAVTSLSLNGVFTGDYDNYMVTMRWTTSGTAWTDLRLRASGSDATTGYTRQYLFAGGTTVAAGKSSTNNLLRAYSYGTRRAGVSMYVFGPYLTQPTAGRTVVVDDSSNASIYEFAGTHSTSSSYDGFSYAFGGTSATGLLTVFGFNQ